MRYSSIKFIQNSIVIDTSTGITQVPESIPLLIAFLEKGAIWIIDVSIIKVTNYDIFRTRVTLGNCVLSFLGEQDFGVMRNSSVIRPYGK